MAFVFSGTATGINTFGQASYTAAETISGSTARAVALNQSGNAIMAMAAISGRMPAVGLTVNNALSGQAVSVVTHGAFQGSTISGLVAPSQICVEQSGAITTTAPATSGFFLQHLGVAANGSGGWFAVDADMHQLP